MPPTGIPNTADVVQNHGMDLYKEVFPEEAIRMSVNATWGNKQLAFLTIVHPTTPASLSLLLEHSNISASSLPEKRAKLQCVLSKDGDTSANFTRIEDGDGTAAI